MYGIKIQPQEFLSWFVHGGKNGNNTIENEVVLSLRLAEEHFRSTPLSQINKSAFCNNTKK